MISRIQKLYAYLLLLCISVAAVPPDLLHHHHHQETKSQVSKVPDALVCQISADCHVDTHLDSCQHSDRIESKTQSCDLCQGVLSKKSSYFSINEKENVVVQIPELFVIAYDRCQARPVLDLVLGRGPPV